MEHRVSIAIGLKGTKCSYRLRMDKMKCIDKMKCSAVVDRAGARAGRAGAEMLEWRTDRRNLTVLVKIVTDITCTRVCG